MVEVETDSGRVAYGPVSAKDVPSLFDAGLTSGGTHKLSLGNPEEIPFLAKQTRLTFARCGITDPLSLDDYKAHGGLKGLANAVATTPAEIVKTVTDSGLRGTRRRRISRPASNGRRCIDTVRRPQIVRLQRRRGR